MSLKHLIRAWLPVAMCMGLIALESSVAFGADHTSGPLQRLLEYLFNTHYTQPQWWRLHIAIRKCGHFTGYGLLSVAWFRAVWMTLPPNDLFQRRRLACHGLAMLGTLLVASADEFHQLFLPNRSGSIVDVGIDCLGGLVLQAIVALWMFRRK